MFSETFITVLILGSLVLTAGSDVALLVLFLNDHRRKRLW